MKKSKRSEVEKRFDKLRRDLKILIEDNPERTLGTREAVSRAIMKAAPEVSAVLITEDEETVNQVLFTVVIGVVTIKRLDQIKKRITKTIRENLTICVCFGTTFVSSFYVFERGQG